MKVVVKRFIDNRSFYKTFEVDYKDETILELLDRLKIEDATLTYRSFCRSSICGTCSVVVNDVSVLACKSRVKDFLKNDEIIIEPLKRTKVLKDLVVDHSYIEESIRKTKSWFVDEIDENRENLQTPTQFEKFNLQTDCILCMACFSECEALDVDNEFAGPFAFTKIFRFAFDSRDKEGVDNRVEVAKENKLYSCVNCQKCAFVCPKHISSAMDIKMLQSNDKNPPFNDFQDFSSGGMFF